MTPGRLVALWTKGAQMSNSGRQLPLHPGLYEALANRTGPLSLAGRTPRVKGSRDRADQPALRSAGRVNDGRRPALRLATTRGRPRQQADEVVSGSFDTSHAPCSHPFHGPDPAVHDRWPSARPHHPNGDGHASGAVRGVVFGRRDDERRPTRCGVGLGHPGTAYCDPRFGLACSRARRAKHGEPTMLNGRDLNFLQGAAREG